MSQITPDAARDALALLKLGREIGSKQVELLQNYIDQQAAIQEQLAAAEALLKSFADKADKKEAAHLAGGFRRPLADSLQISHRLADFRAASNYLKAKSK